MSQFHDKLLGEKNQTYSSPQTLPWYTAKHVYLRCLSVCMEPEEEVWKNTKPGMQFIQVLLGVISKGCEKGVVVLMRSALGHMPAMHCRLDG